MTSSTAIEQPQQQQQEESPSLLMSFTSVFSNLLPSGKADDSEDKDDGEESKDDGETEEGGDDAEEAEEEEEEEEDEPEDPAPAIYEACENSSKCKPAKTHFDHCQERVSEGKGFHGEDCIEEFFHLAHCASECSAPKIFAKLK